MKNVSFLRVLAPPFEAAQILLLRLGILLPFVRGPLVGKELAGAALCILRWWKFIILLVFESHVEDVGFLTRTPLG
jgi:hypothetical protein